MPRKKHIQTGKDEVLSATPAPPASGEEAGELKKFVDNYLSLADKALGFMRRPGNNNLTISTCCFCQHTVASTNLRLLAFAESLHVCPAKRVPVVADDDAA